MAAILDFWVKMMLYRQTSVNIGIRVIDVPRNIIFFFILSALVQQIRFRTRPDGDHPVFLVQNYVIMSH